MQTYTGSTDNTTTLSRLKEVAVKCAKITAHGLNVACSHLLLTKNERKLLDATNVMSSETKYTGNTPLDMPIKNRFRR